ncbi:MAG: cobalamin-binding protein [Chloroflexi bacterium]|nr:MAG: cobalamin-binding protein [Chloroflexota bacterium]
METIKAIYQAVYEGDALAAKEGVEAALQAGLPVDKIMQEGLIDAMSEVGRQFECGEFFVPEMLIAARAMQAGLEPLRPLLAQSGVKSAGRVAIGTIKGDLHDIGKNLVAMMLEGAGFEIIDLGTDVTPEKFVETVRQQKPQLVAMSALLTTTMSNMGHTIQALKDAGVREQVKVIIGGAPVTQEYANQIGADGFAPDASAAARLAKSLVEA